MRTAILADRLHSRGHSIVWWSTNFFHQNKTLLSKGYNEVFIDKNYVIKLIQGLRYSKNISLKRYLHHKLIAKRFRGLAKLEDRPDIIIASMPDYDLAYEAIRYAKNHESQSLVDIRDLWPDIFPNRAPRGLQGVVRLFLKRDFKKLKILLRDADALVAVSKRYLAWALDRADRLANKWDRVFLLGYKRKNSGVESVINGNMETLLSRKVQKDHKFIIFIGTFGASYEILLLIEAASRMQEVGRTDVSFVLAGTGEQAKAIQRQAARLPNVILPGWISADEIYELLQRSHAGILPYVKTAPQSIPNKSFEYISAGLPVISSLQGEMAYLIERYRFGLNYRPGDLRGLCYCIEKLLDDVELREEMAVNALSFFQKHGDADKIYLDYSRHIEHLVEANQKESKCSNAQASF